LVDEQSNHHIKTRIFTYYDLKSHEKTMRSNFNEIKRELFSEGNDLHSLYRRPAGDAFFMVVCLRPQYSLASSKIKTPACAHTRVDSVRLNRPLPWAICP
jgi:hypothetical protein